MGWLTDIFRKVTTPSTSLGTVYVKPSEVSEVTSTPTTVVSSPTTTSTTTGFIPSGTPTTTSSGGGSSTPAPTGTVVEVRDAEGVLTERRFHDETGERVFDEADPTERTGRVTRFDIQRDETGATTGLNELRGLTNAQIAARDKALRERDKREAEQFGGGIFFKESELKERGVETTQTPAQEFFFPTTSEKALITSEELGGQEIGSSGSGFLGQSNLNIKKAPDPGTPSGRLVGDVQEFSQERIFSEKFVENVDIGTQFTSGAAIDQTVFGRLLSKETKQQSSEIISGSLRGAFLPETVLDVGITAATVGVGAAIGFGVRGLGVAALKIPKVGFTVAKSLKYTEVIGGGAIATGAIVGTAGRVSATPDFGEKGQIIGETARTFAAFGAGFKGGEKLLFKGVGVLRTRGRTEIPIERLVQEDVLYGTKNFPTAPKQKQLGLFQQNVERLPELSTEGKPGGFHASPLPVEVGGKITPGAGTSEVPGLFISSDLSIHFTRISGKSSQSAAKGPKGLFDLTGLPTASYVIPRGFRTVKTRTTKPFEIEGQKFFRDFTKPVKEGVADLPLIKTEIEAVLRPGVGEFGRQPSKFFTTIDGVRTPIDVFKFTKGSGKGKAVDVIPGFERIELTPLRRSSFRGSSSRISQSSIISSPISSSFLSSIPSSLTSSKLSSSLSSSSISSSLTSSRLSSSSLSSSFKSPTSSIISSPISSSTSSGSSIIRPPRSPPKKAPPGIPFPLFGQLTPSKKIAGTRSFIETPTFGRALKFDVLGSGKPLPRIKLGSLFKDVRFI